MTLLTQFWYNVLKNMLEINFGDLLTKDQVNNKVDTIIKKFKKIKPYDLYRNCIFLNTHSIFNRYCLDYKYRFVTEQDILKVFEKPFSSEFIDQDMFSQEEIKELEQIMLNEMISLNEYFDRLFYNYSHDKNVFIGEDIFQDYQYETKDVFNHIPISPDEIITVTFVKDVRKVSITTHYKISVPYLLYLLNHDLQSLEVYGTISSYFLDNFKKSYNQENKFVLSFLKKYPQGLTSDQIEYFFF